MEWYWVILIVIVYLLMIGFTTGFLRETSELDDTDTIGMSLVWPLVLPIYFGIYIAEKIFEKNESFTEEE